MTPMLKVIEADLLPEGNAIETEKNVGGAVRGV